MLHAPAWEWEALERAMPEYFARLNMQTAKLHAYMLNRNGGKRPPKEQPKDPPLTGDELYSPEEMLEPHSWFIRVSQDLKPATEKDIADNFEVLPSWCQELLKDYIKR